MDYRSEVFGARYHLDVALRLLRGFDEYGSKMYVVGVIRELARASGKLVRAFLIMDGTRGGLDVFRSKVGKKYLDVDSVELLCRVLEVECEQRRARVELLKRDGVLLEVDGGWRILRFERLRDFAEGVERIINSFPTTIKR